jgi:hypothetical protein
MSKYDNPADLYSGDVFSKELYGVYGTFTPQTSPDLEYLLTNIPIADISSLKTASDVTQFESVTFEELIQRDIDYKRVDEELIGEYLDKGDGRVRFFPPLLVSIIPARNGTRPESGPPVQEFSGRRFIATFGGDNFQLVLNVSPNVTPHSLEFDGQQHYYVPFASIKINPDAVDLVVVDGQHRFEALRRMAKNTEQRQHIEKVEVPVCIFFTRRDLSRKASIAADLRELFVTINSKQKEVSGHFIVLLDDKSLSAHVVRALANTWKTAELIPGRSKLPLLEWNTRDSRSVYQRQKRYSVTTVSAVSECFRDYIFGDTRSGYTHTLLNLAEIQEPLSESPDSPAYGKIDDATFSISQLNLLKRQIDKYIVPALDTLFTAPRPYSALIAAFTNKLANLEEQASNNVHGVKYFLESVLYKYRKCSDNDQQAVKDVEIELDKALAPRPEEREDSWFFTLFFQQGLIRGWARLAHEGVKCEISPPKVAKGYVAALQQTCFNQVASLCAPINAYTQGLLFDGQRIVQNRGARDAWVHLICASFNKPQAMEAFAAALAGADVPKEAVEALEKKVAEVARESARAFMGAFEKRAVENKKKSWRFGEIDGVDFDELSRLESDAANRDAFEQKIKELIMPSCEEAKKALAAALAIPEAEQIF